MALRIFIVILSRESYFYPIHDNLTQTITFKEHKHEKNHTLTRKYYAGTYGSCHHYY